MGLGRFKESNKFNVPTKRSLEPKYRKNGSSESEAPVLKKWSTGLSLGELSRKDIGLLFERDIFFRLVNEEVMGFCYYLETLNNVFVTVGAAGPGARRLLLTRTLFQVGGKMDKFQQKDINLGDRLAESVSLGLKKFGVTRLVLKVRAGFIGGRFKFKRLKKFVTGLRKRGVVLIRLVRRRVKAHNGCRGAKIRRM